MDLTLIAVADTLETYMEIIFDNKQKTSGYNKHGHYQFGVNTCLFCKSDRTEIDRKYIWNGKKESYKKLYKCYDCNGVTGSDI